MAQVPKLYTASEVADAWRVDESTVHRWARDGRIKAVPRPGGTRLFPQSAMPPVDEPAPAIAATP